MQKQPVAVLGMMSGTSLDGLDLALCQFSGQKSYRILDAMTIPYPARWEQSLRHAHSLPAESLLKLHHEYGLFLGRAAKQFLDEKMPGQEVLLGSHGHTIYHNPTAGFSFQLGSGTAIMAASGRDVVCDFRNQDIALGGQGAPLVPAGDRALFGAYGSCLNLGGFANISYESGHTRIAGDIAPCNFILNYWMSRLNLPYDPEGRYAAAGKPDLKLLKQLNDLDYYRTPFPKSLGREWVEQELLPLTETAGCRVEDCLSTLVEHIAFQINRVIDAADLKSVLLSGGGVYNSHLLSALQKNPVVEFVVPGRDLIDFKEALIFAWLAWCRLHGKNNVLGSSTGAKQDHCTGVLYAQA